MGSQPTCECGECKTCKHRAYQREWHLRHPEKQREYDRRRLEKGLKQEYEIKRYHNDPEYRKKKNARSAVSRRVRSGKLTRQPCEVCGMPNAEAHHEDYDKPLEVRWLCTSHHRALHERMIEL